MKGIFCGNGDINLFLTRKEVKEVNLTCILKFKPANEKSLICKLQKNDGSDSGRKANLQYENFESMSDWVKVECKKGTYFVKINHHALDIIIERGYFGTRYGNSQGITIYIPKQCNIHNNLYS